MSINSTEEAHEYLKSVREKLDELEKLSVDAGMYSHAAIWVTIQGTFCEGTDEIETISDMMGMYLKTKLSLPKCSQKNNGNT